MLEFVHLSGPEAGKDQSTRRKVRSQAMRDFRRRQREENHRKHVDLSQVNSGRAEDQATPDVVAALCPSTSQPKPADKATRTRRATSRASLSISSNTHPSFVSRQDCQQPSAAAPSRQARGVSLRDTFSQPSPESHGLTRVQPRAEDVFESQEQIDQMFERCKEYLSWLYPGIDGKLTERVLGSSCDITARPTILAALCLASVGHLDAVRGHKASFDHAVCKARIFRQIREWMKASTSAVSSELVDCLACLLSYEMSKCSRESILHLRGLQSIIRLKGGLDTLGPPLAMTLECLDLCHALMFDGKPLLTTPTALLHGKADNDQHLESCLGAFRLLRNEAENFHHQTPTDDPYKQRLAYIPRLFQDVIDVVDFLGPGYESSETVNVPDEIAAPYRQRLEEARSMGLRADARAPDAHYLARVVYLRILLVYNLDVLRFAPNHPVNQTVIDGLWDTTRKISDEAWAPFPYLRLWVLLAGVTLARAGIKKSFFKAHLTRCVFRMGIPEWDRVKAFIMRYLSSRAMRLETLAEGPSSDDGDMKRTPLSTSEEVLSWDASRHRGSTAEQTEPSSFQSVRGTSEHILPNGSLAPSSRSLASVRSQQAISLPYNGMATTHTEYVDSLHMDEEISGMQDMYDIWLNTV